MKRASLFLVVLAVVLGLGAWRLLTLPAPSRTDASLRVTATFYPLAYFAERVGRAHVQVKTLTPPGAEPHEYEPTPQDLVATRESQVVLMNGGVDAWLDRVVPDLRSSGVRVVRVADAIPSIEHDPHVWLDPILASRIVGLISDAFVAADPAHADDYRANTAALQADLAAIDQEYETALKTCESRTVVASHDAFGYLAKRYDLNILPIAGLSPDEEPSPKRMAEIADQAKAANARVIFFEELVSPKLAETIAREIGAKTDVFNPIEGLTPEDQAADKDYMALMRRNLQSLKNALLCQ